MKIRKISIMLAFCAILLSACSAEKTVEAKEIEAEGGENKSQDAYHKIDAEEAKRMMDEEEIILVDVRRPMEYEESHIPGAILLPNENIEDFDPVELPDKEAVLLIYCRTGVRSKQASDKLVKLGYKHVYDMGGITDWPYETVSELSSGAGGG